MNDWEKERNNRRCHAERVSKHVFMYKRAASLLIISFFFWVVVRCSEFIIRGCWVKYVKLSATPSSNKLSEETIVVIIIKLFLLWNHAELADCSRARLDGILFTVYDRLNFLENFHSRWLHCIWQNKQSWLSAFVCFECCLSHKLWAWAQFTIAKNENNANRSLISRTANRKKISQINSAKQWDEVFALAFYFQIVAFYQAS